MHPFDERLIELEVAQHGLVALDQVSGYMDRGDDPAPGSRLAAARSRRGSSPTRP